MAERFSDIEKPLVSNQPSLEAIVGYRTRTAELLRGNHLGQRSNVFRNRQNIAVRIFEPSHLVATGSRPNPQLVLFQEAESLEVNPSVVECSHHFLNARNLPSQNRERCRFEFRSFRDPDHDPICIQYQSKPVIFDEAKSQHSLVKGPCLSRVSGGNEGNDIDCTQHSVFLD
jgi:hypothetical protein